jgi:hypothetical protein
MVPKNTEFHADFKSLKIFFLNVQQKVLSKTSLTNMSKSGIVHIFIMFLLITFFGTFFKNFFNRFEISMKCAQDGSKKNGKPFFYKRLLEFN